MQWSDQCAAWIARGDRIAVATVVATRGASPQPVGTQMAVNARGEVAGAVSGGCVEGAVVDAAERVLAGGPARLLHFADELVGGVGLPCGGEIDVWVEPLGPELEDFLARRRRGEAAVRRTHLPDGQVFVDAVEAAPRLILIGAAAVAAELSAMAALAGWRTFVADPRARFATLERFPAASEVAVCWPAVALERWGPPDARTAVLAISHDRKIDDAAICAALAGEAGFIGAIGSRRATLAREARLLEAGVTPEALARLSAPVGLDIGGAGAAETALSILAEIVAVSNRRAGGRLSAGHGPIHGPSPYGAALVRPL